MNIDNLDFSSEKEIAKFVDACEQRYRNDVKEACEIALGGGKIITLCGPTCSGKTTTSLILDDIFLNRGKELHTISIDDFYFNCDLLEKMSRECGKPLDYDSPSTIDIELFGKVVADIEKGGKVALPKFDFKLGKRVGMTEIFVTDDDVFLFEGIQAVYPSLTAHLSTHQYTSLFISVDRTVECFLQTFLPRELRLMRRLVRDARTRGADAEFTLDLWDSVCKNEDTNIYPNVGNCHKRIDSSFEYEVCVIKPFVLPLLESVPKDSKHRKEAERIIKKLENIPIIDASFVPKGSVFREFIG